jgi:hypothetical protein
VSVDPEQGQRAVAVVRPLAEKALQRSIVVERISRLEGLQKLRIHSEHGGGFIQLFHGGIMPRPEAGARREQRVSGSEKRAGMC